MTPTDSITDPDRDKSYDPAKEDQGSDQERIKEGILPIPPAETPPVPVDDPPAPGQPPLIDEEPDRPAKIIA